MHIHTHKYIYLIIIKEKETINLKVGCFQRYSKENIWEVPEREKEVEKVI